MGGTISDWALGNHTQSKWREVKGCKMDLGTQIQIQIQTQIQIQMKSSTLTVGGTISDCALGNHTQSKWREVKGCKMDLGTQIQMSFNSLKTIRSVVQLDSAC